MSENPFKNLEEEEIDMTVTLCLDDGSEVECEVLAIFPASNKQMYVALLPVEQESEDEDDIYLYRYSEDADGNPVLDNIEDDEEYDIVADAFDELMDSEEYDELFGDEDDDKTEATRTDADPGPASLFLFCP